MLIWKTNSSRLRLTLIETVKERIASSKELKRECGLDTTACKSISRHIVAELEKQIWHRFKDTDKFAVEPPSRPELAATSFSYGRPR